MATSENRSEAPNTIWKQSAFTCEALRAPAPLAPPPSTFGPPAASTYLRSYLALLCVLSLQIFPCDKQREEALFLPKAHCRMSSSGKNELISRWRGKESGRGIHQEPSPTGSCNCVSGVWRSIYALEQTNVPNHELSEGRLQKACRVCAWAACPPNGHGWGHAPQPGLLAALPGEYWAFCPRGPKRGSLTDLGTQFQRLSKNLTVPKSNISFPNGGSLSHAFKNCQGKLGGFCGFQRIVWGVPTVAERLNPWGDLKFVL